MLSYVDALRIVEQEGGKRFARSRVERLQLLECFGRCVASEGLALDDNPRFDNS